jgi:hypothetical protein
MWLVSNVDSATKAPKTDSIRIITLHTNYLSIWKQHKTLKNWVKCENCKIAKPNNKTPKKERSECVLFKWQNHDFPFSSSRFTHIVLLAVHFDDDDTTEKKKETRKKRSSKPTKNMVFVWSMSQLCLVSTLTVAWKSHTKDRGANDFISNLCAK